MIRLICFKHVQNVVIFHSNNVICESSNSNESNLQDRLVGNVPLLNYETAAPWHLFDIPHNSGNKSNKTCSLHASSTAFFNIYSRASPSNFVLLTYMRSFFRIMVFITPIFSDKIMRALIILLCGVFQKKNI